MTNSNLVFLSEDKTTPLTSTYIIAKALNREVRDLNRLITRFRADFEGFGAIVISDHRCIKTNNGGYKNINDYYLNEQQATLLVTYLRNSETVRQFKVALVKAFFEMRNQLQSTSEKKYTEAEVAQQCKEIQSLAYSLGYAKGIEAIKPKLKEKEELITKEECATLQKNCRMLFDRDVTFFTHTLKLKEMITDLIGISEQLEAQSYQSHDIFRDLNLIAIKIGKAKGVSYWEDITKPKKQQSQKATA